jgi:outer membrane protein
MNCGFYGLGRRKLRAGAQAARILLLCGPVLAVSPLHAQTITQAWERALAAEPALQAAHASYRAAGERTNHARASLLPHIDASVDRQKNRRSFIQDTTNPFTGEPSPEISERYPSRTAQVNITQPLWRPGNWMSLSQAHESEQQAAFQALATEQELQTRFVTAWFDVMGSRDNLLQATDQVNATRQQLEVMRRGVRVGTQSEVQAAEAQAKHEQAVAERAAAAAEVDAKLALLEQVTGPLGRFVPPVLKVSVAEAMLPPLEPLAVWMARVEAESPAIRAAERGVAAARDEVRKQQSLHQPTLDFVARHARVLQGSGNSPGQSGYRSREHFVGFQLNVPLFAGGGMVAKVREAQAMAEKAEADLETARRSAAAQARQAWSATQAAQARAEGADYWVRASELALEAALTGQVAGLKTPLDELQARQQLATARRDQQRAHYDRVVSFVRLRDPRRQSAPELFAQVERLLSPPTAVPPASFVASQ